MKIDSIKPHLTHINKNELNDRKIEKFSFRSFLSNAIEHVDNAEKVSNAFDEQLAAGKLDNLHDAMIAAQKAEITLNLALEIRGQVLDAYREIMRIQV